MKYIIFFFFISTAAIVVPNMLKPTIQDSVVAKAETTKFSPEPDSSWFEKNLEIYIPADYIPFNPIEYKHALTKGIKDTLGLDDWLGTFTIGDMIRDSTYTMINFSRERNKKIMFITPTYFVLTSYMDPDKSTGITYGSSIIYFPQKNVLQELKTFIVFDALGDTLDGAFEHYETGENKHVEYGQYHVYKKTFTLAE